MGKSKYFCGNTDCVWNDKRKCVMDYVTCKYCEKRLKNSVILNDKK